MTAGADKDLSEGGGQDFLGTKKFIIIGTKNHATCEIFFDWKDSKSQN